MLADLDPEPKPESGREEEDLARTKGRTGLVRAVDRTKGGVDRSRLWVVAMGSRSFPDSRSLSAESNPR